MRTFVSRFTILALTAAAVGLTTPAAHAAGVYRYDDGTREQSVYVRHNGAGQGVQVRKNIPLPPQSVTGSTGAVLWVYAQADGCGATGATQRLVVNFSTVVEQFNPCDHWPSTSYDWHAFTVPLSALNENVYGNYFEITKIDTSVTDRNAYYGIDMDSGHAHSTIWDQSGGGTILGELMWYVELTGSIPAVSATPSSIDFGNLPLGTSSVAKTVTVKSIGLEPISGLALALGGAAAGDYATSNDTCTGATLGSGATCTVQVTFTPSASLTRAATLTVSTTEGPTATVSLTGEGRGQAPTSQIATASLSLVGPVDLAVVHGVSGTVTDDDAIAVEYLTFTPLVPLLPTVTLSATLTCDAARTACDWSALPLLTPGIYTMTAHGIDARGNPESPGPSIQVIAV